MSQLRKDPITREWVVIASEDVGKALEFAAARAPAPTAPPQQPCPFCPGQEAVAGPEVLAYRPVSTEPDAPGWRVRVVAGSSPVLACDGGLQRRDELLYDTMRAVGAHEIVIETPRHEASLADLEATDLAEVLWACRERTEALARPEWVRYVSVFRNHLLETGPEAAHPHSRVVALPVVPQAVWDHARGLREYYDYRGRCAVCHIIEQEVRAGERVVHQNRACVTVAPYASRRPFELWLLPRRHAPGLGWVEAAEMRHLAAAFKDALQRLKASLGDPPYHCHVVAAPCHVDDMEHVHWSIAITPRLPLPGAQQLDCGLSVNPVPPEQAAGLLRDAVAPTLEVGAGRR